jgi:hypothetical protein
MNLNNIYVLIILINNFKVSNLARLIGLKMDWIAKLVKGRATV